MIFTSLPGPKEVEPVVFGPDGILAGVQPGTAYFDLSTNAQALVRRFAAALAEKGAFGFDAPVSGGPKGAETGKLAIWVGGDRAVFDRYKPVLDDFGDQARYIGPIGSGDGRQAGPQHGRLRHPDRRWPRSSPWASRRAWTRSTCGPRCGRAR